jgi:hypothetical protein
MARVPPCPRRFPVFCIDCEYDSQKEERVVFRRLTLPSESAAGEKEEDTPWAISVSKI